jgi:hypothetical protein
MSAATKLNRKEKAAQLHEYDLTSSSTRNILIQNVKQMFQRGEIRTQAAAALLPAGIAKIANKNAAY